MKKNSGLEPFTVMDIPGYPLVFELDRGETVTIVREDGSRSGTATFRLVDYELFRENNLWFREPLPQTDIYKARVFVEINGVPDTLIKRAYQSPENIGDFRWYIETIAEWDSTSEADPVTNMEKEVRISTCLAGETWGPSSSSYPIQNYRWRSSSYMNTWSSLVPYNLLYYHHGEDMGAIPDILDVVSIFDGEIIRSAYPDGDGKSNAIMIKNKKDIVVRYSHMNTGKIKPSAAAGRNVRSGQVLGKTGETWDGRRSQETDPHLHVGISYINYKLGSFPYLMEAYFRNYPDKVLGIAGGYRFGLPGDTIELDASRSLVASGHRIKDITWITHKMDTLHGARQKLIFDAPGLYSQQLLVRTESGETDRDFLQVRIFNPSGNGREEVCGFVHYTPVRDISPGDTVLFWNRLWNNIEPVEIDFGDGSSPEFIEKEITHVFTTTGKYVVTFSTVGKNNEPAAIQVEVIVE